MAGLGIGAVARASGLTVRTLHHYDELGLVVPGERTDAGHRRYGRPELERLYRVQVLQQLGLQLAEIRMALDDDGWDLAGAVRRHREETERRAAELAVRLARLDEVRAQLDDAGASLATETVITLLEETSMQTTLPQRRIQILCYADLDAAFTHLTEVFGLGRGEVTRDDDGRPVHAEVHAGDGVIWLHPESPEYGLRAPSSLGAATGMVSVFVDDVDAHHDEVRSRGAAIDYAPMDQPYGYREYGARDHEGRLWSFMRPL